MTKVSIWIDWSLRFFSKLALNGDSHLQLKWTCLHTHLKTYPHSKGRIYTARLAKRAKVMFSQASVCSQGGGGLPSWGGGGLTTPRTRHLPSHASRPTTYHLTRHLLTPQLRSMHRRDASYWNAYLFNWITVCVGDRPIHPPKTHPTSGNSYLQFKLRWMHVYACTDLTKHSCVCNMCAWNSECMCGPPDHTPTQ